MQSKYNFDISVNVQNSDIESNNSISYDIRLKSNGRIVGNIDIRPVMSNYLYYLGQIGYNIYPEFRGNNYAYKACLLLFELAQKEYDLSELYITCSPDNAPSYKILSKLKGELLEIAEVPKEHELYCRNEKTKCIFHYDLNILR